MFIAPLLTVTTRAPAERNVSDMIAQGESFAPLERGESFWSREFYKHFVPTGRGKCLENLAKKKQEVGPLYYRGSAENFQLGH